jgi:hypothetical protein
MDDAVRILEHVPGVKIDMYPRQVSPGNAKQMQWQFNPSGESGIADTDEQGTVIFTVYLNFDRYVQSVTVSELVSAYGQPTDVFLYYCTNNFEKRYCTVHLIYQEKGMALEIGLTDNWKKGYQVRILPDTKISGAWLFSATEDGYAKALGKNTSYFPEYLYKWKGYTNYP